MTSIGSLSQQPDIAGCGAVIMCSHCLSLLGLIGLAHSTAANKLMAISPAKAIHNLCLRHQGMRYISWGAGSEAALRS